MKSPNLSRRLVLLLPAVLGIAPDALAGGDLFMLINARNPTSGLSHGEVKNMFTGKTGFWHGVVPVKLFVRPGGSDPGKAFYEPVLGMTPQAFAQHWSKLQLAGKGVTPPTAGSVSDLVTQVSKVPGAIGFVLGAEAWQANGVKIIQLK
jgi:ABC-type phosphate transport system substrate-binding protein